MYRSLLYLKLIRFVNLLIAYLSCLFKLKTYSRNKLTKLQTELLEDTKKIEIKTGNAFKRFLDSTAKTIEAEITK